VTEDLEARLGAVLADAVADTGRESVPRWEPGQVRDLWSALAPDLAPDPTAAAIAERFRIFGAHLLPLPMRDLAIAGPLLARHAGAAYAASASELTVVARAGSGARFESGTLTAACGLVAHADAAGAFIVVVEGGGVFRVAAQAPGIVVERQESFDVCRRPATVRLDAVSATPVLDATQAADWWSEVTALCRLAVAAETHGALEAVCDEATGYAGARHQFGRPIGSFQAVQHMLAGMAARTYTLGGLCERAAAAPPAELARVATAAKAYAAEVGLDVVERALQVHGAIGYTQERPLHLYFKRVMTLSGAWGERRALHREIGLRHLRRDRAA
jgi:hypothetical protein